MNERVLIQLYSEKELALACQNIAKKLDSMLGRDVTFVVVLDGAFIFAADLVRHFAVASATSGVRNVQIAFIDAKSYRGEERGALAVGYIDPSKIRAREVVIVDEIADSGATLDRVRSACQELGATKVLTAVMLAKLAMTALVDVHGLVAPEAFVVGYGLDLDGRFREVPNVSVIA